MKALYHDQFFSHISQHKLSRGNINLLSLKYFTVVFLRLRCVFIFYMCSTLSQPWLFQSALLINKVVVVVVVFTQLYFCFHQLWPTFLRLLKERDVTLHHEIVVFTVMCTVRLPIFKMYWILRLDLSFEVRLDDYRIAVSPA